MDLPPKTTGQFHLTYGAGFQKVIFIFAFTLPGCQSYVSCKYKQIQKPYKKMANTTIELDNQGVCSNDTTESTEEYICVECKKSVDEVVQYEKCTKWFYCICIS